MKKVALYIRVSTARQDVDGFSIPMQKDRLVAFCKAKGWVVAGVFVDPGHSGSSLDRPGIASLIDGVAAGKYDIVLVYKLDRLSRSQKDTLYLIEDVFMSNKTDFVSMQESFDTSTIFGRAMVGILSVFSQMERETIVERTLMGRSGRASDGMWHGGGTDPIGYDYIDGELVVNQSEAHQVFLVYEMYASGLSVTEITRRMDGWKTKHGDWTHSSTVGNVLDNPLYAGTVHFDGVEAKGKHEPIISAELDAKVKSRRARLRRVESAGDSSFMLTGLLRCAACGARYFAHRRPSGRVVYSCHSRAKKNKKMVVDPGCKAPHIPVTDLDAMVEDAVMSFAADPVKVSEVIKKRAAGHGGSERSEDLRRLDAEIGRLMDLLQRDTLASVGEIADRLEKAHTERLSIRPAQIDPRGHDIVGFKSLLRELFSCWHDLDVRGRRIFLLQLIDTVRVDGEGIAIEWSI